MVALKFILLIICSYFLGNISFARLVAKMQKKDITKEGSGNPGTLNMLRNHGFIMAFSTLLLDALKGAIPALVGLALFDGFNNPTLISDIAVYAGGFSAVLGHCFPVIYKFKGGKGIATSFGMFTVANPIVSLVLFVIFLALIFIVKVGSFCTLSYVLFMTIFETIRVAYEYSWKCWPILVMLYLIFFFVFYSHRGNLKRLFTGTERKINIKSVASKDKELFDNISNRKKKNANEDELSQDLEMENNASDEDKKDDELNSSVEEDNTNNNKKD